MYIHKFNNEIFKLHKGEIISHQRREEITKLFFHHSSLQQKPFSFSYYRVHDDNKGSLIMGGSDLLHISEN